MDRKSEESAQKKQTGKLTGGAKKLGFEKRGRGRAWV